MQKTLAEQYRKIKPKPAIPPSRTCPDVSRVSRGRMCPPTPGIPSKPQSKPSRAERFKRERLNR